MPMEGERVPAVEQGSFPAAVPWMSSRAGCTTAVARHLGVVAGAASIPRVARQVLVTDCGQVDTQAAWQTTHLVRIALLTLWICNRWVSWEGCWKIETSRTHLKKFSLMAPCEADCQIHCSQRLRCPQNGQLRGHRHWHLCFLDEGPPQHLGLAGSGGIGACNVIKPSM